MLKIMATVKGLLLILLLVALAVLALRAAVRIYEPRVLFHPEPGLTLNPTIAGLPFEDAAIRSGDLFIHGWLLPGESHNYVIYYHGNAGTIADRLAFLQLLAPLKLNFLIIDYRGYGRSEGQPTVEGLEQDAKAAVGWLMGVKKIPPERIVLWGHSTGAAAAFHAALHHPEVAGVISESAFVSPRRVAMQHFPWAPVAFITDRLDNGQAVEKVMAPKLFLHGTADALLPYAHSEELFRRAADPKRVIFFKGATHSDIARRNGEGFLKIIKAFVDDPAKFVAEEPEPQKEKEEPAAP